MLYDSKAADRLQGEAPVARPLCSTPDMVFWPAKSSCDLALDRRGPQGMWGVEPEAQTNQKHWISSMKRLLCPDGG